MMLILRPRLLWQVWDSRSAERVSSPDGWSCDGVSECGFWISLSVFFGPSGIFLCINDSIMCCH